VEERDKGTLRLGKEDVDEYDGMNTGKVRTTRQIAPTAKKEARILSVE